MILVQTNSARVAQAVGFLPQKPCLTQQPRPTRRECAHRLCTRSRPRIRALTVPCLHSIGTQVHQRSKAQSCAFSLLVEQWIFVFCGDGRKKRRRLCLSPVFFSFFLGFSFHHHHVRAGWRLEIVTSKVISKAPTLHPKSTMLLCRRCSQGNGFFKNGDYRNAVAKYSDAIGVDPSNHAYWSNRR